MFHFLSVDIFLPFSCCLFQNVSHSPSLSSCHSPLRFPLPSSTLISHYQRCHVGEWMLWGSRGMFSASAKRPAKCETPLWNIYPNLLRFTPFLSHILNATYKAIHLQSSRWSVSSVFLLFIWLIGRKDKKKQKDNKKKNMEIYWSTTWPPGGRRRRCGALQRLSSTSLQPWSLLSFCSHSVWAFTVKSAADLEKILLTEVPSKSYRILFGEADGLLWQWASFRNK